MSVYNDGNSMPNTVVSPSNVLNVAVKPNGVLNTTLTGQEIIAVEGIDKCFVAAPDSVGKTVTGVVLQLMADGVIIPCGVTPPGPAEVDSKKSKRTTRKAKSKSEEG